MKNGKSFKNIIISILVGLGMGVSGNGLYLELDKYLDECLPTEKTLPCVELVDVIDGDTIKINIPYAHPLFGKEISVRLKDIDTPEMRGPAPQCEKEIAIRARDILRETLENAGQIDLWNVKRGKYFRIVADVYTDGLTNAADILIENALAIKYSGGTKPKINWCNINDVPYLQ